MSALTILIIRHAEKPGGAWPGPGLTAEGVEDEKSLVIRGWQRAGAWAALFGSDRGGADFPSPTRMYAANPRAEGAPAGVALPSQRPDETVTPLAAKLDQKAVTTFAQGQEAELANDAVKQSGTVLISWEHKKIVTDLLPAIAGGADLDLPTHWPGERFDVVLRFDRAGAEADWQFRQLFPMLLSGDSDTPLP
jgi:hypothetical protein